MRALILAVPAILLLGACGGGDSAQNASATGEGLASDAVYVNDSTAIDAASGADANMAADVDLNFGNEDSGSGDNSTRPNRSRRTSGTSAPNDRDDTEPEGPVGNVTAPEDGAPETPEPTAN